MDEKSNSKRNKKVLWRFLSYVKPYWFLIVLAAIGGVVKFTTPLAFPQVMRYFIDFVFSPSSTLTAEQKLFEVNKWSLAIVAIYLFIWVPFTYIRHYFAGMAGHRVIFDLRYQLYQHIQRMSASYYNQNQSGAIVSRLINDIALAQNMVGNALTNIWMDGTVIIVLLVIMFKMNFYLTLAALSIFPIYIFATRRLGKLVKQNSRMVQDEIEEISGDLQQKIAGFAVVQTFAREKFEQLQFFRESRKLLEYTIQSARLSSINMVVVGFLTATAPVFVVWIASQLILRSGLTVGEMIVFYSYLGQFYFPINRFSELNVIFSTSLAAIERIFEVFDMQPDVKEKEDAIECSEDFKGEIEFRNVTFSYEEDKKVLNGLNLKIPAGKKVAIVGSSGSGKSTLVSLLPRFYDCSDGSILLDGRDVRDYKLRSLRQNIGMVLQETILFSGSLMENIRYGNPRASKKQVIEAAKAANAYDFITQLPDGFNTEVGERGVKLSGGQKQRIAITRVFLKNPKILLLDEATSALDSESENLIQDALERLMRGRTTVVIAHRLSTIIDADMIVVMNKGQIMEIGSHDELMAKYGFYRHLFEEQFKDIKEIIEV